ncbi:M4 family metallopeptidase, partial [Aeromicrobium sp.]|uniref:M4 family metallopeptidase n=1 Tax=Aeromicrobium sp. TaxID=1871063 RepID=UPI003D6C5C42
MSCSFVPAYLLERLASGCDDSHPCHRTLAIDRRLRSARATAQPRPPAATSGAAWTIHSAENTAALPGTPVRAAGEPASGDVAVDEAYAGVEATLAMLTDVYGRSSYDGRGAPVIATVHYEQNYDNAFWDGMQLVFGDGDGEVFERFTKPIDVLAHELSHALTEHTAGLIYQGQSGALNESVSDVFASCLKQRVLGHDANDADWLIGEGIFRPGIQGRALRSMSEPGTAYDDARIGRDPQVGSMADYVETTEDDGGVHINSGIPNRAFQLAATAIGGSSAEGAGRIWYEALTGGAITSATDFTGFAEAVIASAGEHTDVVTDAWRQVGVVSRPHGSAAGGAPGSTTGSVPEPVDPATGSGTGSEPGRVVVRRSGGFAGMVTEGAVDLHSDDPRVPQVRVLVARIDFASITITAPPQPDRF